LFIKIILPLLPKNFNLLSFKELGFSYEKPFPSPDNGIKADIFALVNPAPVSK